jgi:hypothetical protein
LTSIPPAGSCGIPELGLSFAILCNSGEGALGERFANRIIELFTPGGDEAEAGAAEPAVVTGAAGAAAQDPSSRAGLFFSEGTVDPLRLVVQNGKLRVGEGPELAPVGHNGSPPFPFLPVDCDTFQLTTPRVALSV